jgi:hypothetical protein
MAEIISSPSLGGGTLPSNAGELIRQPDWGIDATLSGYILQNLNVTTERITDTTQDQKGAVVSQLDYDEHQTLSFTAIGGNGEEVDLPNALKPGQTDFTFGNKKWKLQSVAYAGTYNGKKQYTIQAERWKNWPPES